MPRRTALVAAISAVVGAALIAPIAFQTGRGPTIKHLEVTAKSHGRPGGVLMLQLKGGVQTGCIPRVSRYFAYWDEDSTGHAFATQAPLADITTMADLPPIPQKFAKLPRADYRGFALPLPTGLMPGDYQMMVGLSAAGCRPLSGVTREPVYLSNWVDVTIDPILPASSNNPPAAAIQKAPSR
jgi:hypothetical protein